VHSFFPLEHTGGSLSKRALSFYWPYTLQFRNRASCRTLNTRRLRKLGTLLSSSRASPPFVDLPYSPFPPHSRILAIHSTLLYASSLRLDHPSTHTRCDPFSPSCHKQPPLSPLSSLNFPLDPEFFTASIPSRPLIVVRIRWSPKMIFKYEVRSPPSPSLRPPHASLLAWLLPPFQRTFLNYLNCKRPYPYEVTFHRFHL